jgi:glyoxylase-like metal-dependent hydrolase (beta-lactamase superfamily II)/outer membrane lipoprotein-sorting protein
MKYYLFILILLPLASKAQSPAAILQQAISYNGNWEAIKSLEYEISRGNYNPFQSYDYEHPKEQTDQFEIAVDLASGQYMHHTVNHYPGGYVFNTTRIGRDSLYYVYDVTGSRTGKTLYKLNKAFYTESYGEILSSFPYYILKEIANSGDSLQSEQVNQEVVIRRKLKSGAQELWLDAQTAQLHKIVNTNGSNIHTQFFDDYTTMEGYLIPRQVKQTFSRGQVLTDHLESFHVNSTIKEELFKLPAGYHLEEEVTRPLVAKEIAKDIFLVEKVDDDRNVIFINMKDYIVLTEAPVSEGITAGVLDLIHKTLPGKPIKYVHLSHFHADHAGGLRKVLAEGASIVCTPAMEKPIRAMLPGTDPAFVFFKEHKTISDNSHRIELFKVPNSHAQGLSFMYLPAESIIFEGDLLSLPEDSTLTPAIDVYKEFYQYLKNHQLSYNRIIGHHGLSYITPEMFEKIN